MRKWLLILPLILFCRIALGDFYDDIRRIQIPFVVAQESKRGTLTINQAYAEHAIGSYINADGIYENTTNTIFCEVRIRATAFDHEGTVLAVENTYFFDSSYGLIRPGMRIKLKFLLNVKGEARKIKNIVFSIPQCGWRDKDNKKQ